MNANNNEERRRTSAKALLLTRTTSRDGQTITSVIYKTETVFTFCLISFSIDYFRQYQQRIPYELLSGLANCLLNETIFKIVEGLTEIQQVTEKQLLQQRLKLLHKQRGNFVCFTSVFLYFIVSQLRISF